MRNAGAFGLRIGRLARCVHPKLSKLADREPGTARHQPGTYASASPPGRVMAPLRAHAIRAIVLKCGRRCLSPTDASGDGRDGAVR
jgi:hypothetical protein